VLRGGQPNASLEVKRLQETARCFLPSASYSSIGWLEHGKQSVRKRLEFPAELYLKPTRGVGHGWTRMHTDEVGLTYPCSSVSKILSPSSKIRLMKMSRARKPVLWVDPDAALPGVLTVTIRKAKRKRRRSCPGGGAAPY
jgi:hypothetical protein